MKSKDFMAFLFCKPWLHGFCTVFARSVLSMSDYVGHCIALHSVPFFASGEQCQAELCLHFRVGILEQLQKSRHGDGGLACGGYSLRAVGVGLGIEAAFKLLAQLHTGGLLDMSGARSSRSDLSEWIVLGLCYKFLEDLCADTQTFGNLWTNEIN